MNDTLGPERIVPSSFVVGDFPSLRSFTGPAIPWPALAERPEIALEARRYFEQHLAQSKVNRALRHKAPSATDLVYQPGDKVLVWRAEQVGNRLGEWLGPYTIVSSDPTSKIVLFQKSTDARYEK